jgi:dTDP-4-amino-4,6-dideoxygalactose transaminase
VAAGQLAGNGRFTKQCQAWLERRIGAPKVLLTHSCTAALEMAALLIDLEPGDEVIMPSFTFVSSANAFVLRGARPVFVDIRADTLNLDERQVEAAITERTKALLVMHYAGVACEMDALVDIATRHNLIVVEDAAHALLSSYKGRPLGGFGHLATFSFHETKNIISGEGGALVINDARFMERAEIIWEKGTNRSQFSRGRVDKYTWMDVGSSFLPGELTAAFLWAQLEEADDITARRLDVWNRYRTNSSAIEALGLRMPMARQVKRAHANTTTTATSFFMVSIPPKIPTPMAAAGPAVRLRESGRSSELQAARSPPLELSSSARNRSSARESRVLTVFTGRPSRAAIASGSRFS